MRREVKKHGWAEPPDSATIIIDKNGMKVENKNPSYITDDSFIRSFLRSCLDMDTWQHSWHIKIENAKGGGTYERKQIKNILDGKIELRKREIEELKDAKHILSKWGGMKMTVREGDIYRFKYFEQKSFIDPYWCFDGKLIVLCDSRGELKLVDTYWLYDFQYSPNAKQFTVEQATEKGEMEFICNIHNVRFVNEDCYKYYRPEDIFNLTHHHGYKKKFAVRENAEKDPNVMTDAIMREIHRSQQEIDFQKRVIERLEESLREIKSGDLNVYI